MKLDYDVLAQMYRKMFNYRTGHLCRTSRKNNIMILEIFQNCLS